MAHIQKLKRTHTYSYRAIIKRKGIKTITKVFSSKFFREADWEEAPDKIIELCNR